MATSKTLAPTNVTIQIPAFTDKPDQRVNSNCIDKEADAINALSDQIASSTATGTRDTTYTQNGVCNLYKFGKVVMGYFNFQAAANAPGTNPIFTIPEGYRPIDAVHAVASALNSNTYAHIIVGSSGNVAGTSTNNKMAANEWYQFTATWICS